MKTWTLRLMALAAVVAIIPACSSDGDDGATGPQGPPGSANAWSRLGNAATVDGTNFAGTTDNVAFTVRVNNVRALRVEPTAGAPNLVGGFSGNAVTAGAVGATIAGGGDVVPGLNTVTDDYGTVGGGWANRAGNGAGSTNDTLYATVGGGGFNVASGQESTVGGGSGNIASGLFATVPGGTSNTASGAGSFAAGTNARATASGAFTWSDNTPSFLINGVVGQFMARASGGYALFTNAGATTGVTMAAGSGTWVSLSDRNVKANFVRVNGRKTLEKVAAMPIETWNYKTQDAKVRHIGPMAQDFYAAFNLGEDERGIATIDADGVALSAIQGLYEIVKEKDEKIASLEAKNSSLEARLSAIEKAFGK